MLRWSLSIWHHLPSRWARHCGLDGRQVSIVGERERMGSEVWAAETHHSFLCYQERGKEPAFYWAMACGSVNFLCNSRSSTSWGHLWSILNWATGRLVCDLGSNQELLRNLLRTVTSPDDPESFLNLVASSCRKNPELGVYLSVTLTPTFMTLGNITINLITSEPKRKGPNT